MVARTANIAQIRADAFSAGELQGAVNEAEVWRTFILNDPESAKAWIEDRADLSADDVGALIDRRAREAFSAGLKAAGATISVG
jgi:hypothetical protein